MNRFQRDLDTGGTGGEITPEIKPVQIVTIKNKIPLFKGEEQATAIEKIEIEENGFSLVSQKDLYQIGDKAVYIQPDFSLSDIPLFESFIRPFGEPKKSKLGSNLRIRAVKFNLHTGDYEPTFSVGILLPINEVNEYLLTAKPDGETLTERLGITKWEEPDNTGGGLKVNGGKQYPSGVYKTDETNVKNLWGHIENKLGYPVHFIGSEKVDGSSTSIIVDKGKASVGSRTYIKTPTIVKVTGRRTPSFWERIKMFFGVNIDLLIREEVENDDQFIVLSKPYIEKIEEKVKEGKVPENFILRGEGNGQSWKGSGNKNNPHSKNEPNILFYGADNYTNGLAIKADETTFQSYMDVLEFNRCKVIFDKIFNSREEIENECKEYFKTNLIEGIVLRTPDSKFSAKFMNEYYDSLKN